MDIDDVSLDDLLKRLHLANARRSWRDVIARAEREDSPYRTLLVTLAAEEIGQRKQTRLQRLCRRAQFPFLKTIDDFDFTYQSSLRYALLGSFLSPDFVTDGRCLILSGKPGRGKTHLAIAIAYCATQNGFDAFFTSAAALIEELSTASREGHLQGALSTFLRTDVLVVDEVGYLSYGDDAANMLFRVVHERHQWGRPMVFTTNKALKAWGAVLHDDDLADAIIDRVLERGRHLALDGPSYRTKHLKLDEASGIEEAQQARVSGTDRPEFPEPTTRSRRSGPTIAEEPEIARHCNRGPPRANVPAERGIRV